MLQPLTGLLVFSVFFGRLIRVDTGGVPYPLFAFTGMVSWFFFSQILTSAGQSLLEGQHLIRKVYFPRLVLPLSKVLTASVELLISILLLFILLLIYRRPLHWPVLILPVAIVCNVLTALSVAVWLCALTVRHRDFHHIIPYLANLGIWLTPVFYPATLLPPDYQWVLYWNPMAATIAMFRWALTGTPMSPYYWISFVPVLVLLLGGLNYFRKIENKIAENL